jgi:hypothetical protein
VGRLVGNQLQQHEAQAAVTEHAPAAASAAASVHALFAAAAGKTVFMLAAGGAAVVMVGVEMSHDRHPS